MLLPAMSAYNTAKLVICRFTEYTAFEYADQDILAMAVHLGVRQVCGLVCQRSCTWVGKDLLAALGWGSNVLLTCVMLALTDTPELVANTIVWLTEAQMAICALCKRSVGHAGA